ncbi:hypothetical protein B0H16DRAFT_1225729, partial [Mycena metata]
EDEHPAPALGNLSTHYNKHHKDEAVPSDAASGNPRKISASSAKIMGDFLAEGKLNPVINSTQGNFLKIFAAWIIEDDLAFTTGETEGIKRLFAFLQTCYMLPSDTTVLYLIAAALDNAKTNDVLIRALSQLLREKYDIQFVPENSQIRCLTHVVNLVVQKLLAALEEGNESTLEEDCLSNKDLLFHYDPALDAELKE